LVRKHVVRLLGLPCAGGLAVAGALALAPAAQASSSGTLYVNANTGKDSGSCSQASPCKTIGYAVGAAVGGDTIDVAAGLYLGEVDLSKRVHIVGPGIDQTANPSGSTVAEVTGGINGFRLEPGADGSSIEGMVVSTTGGEGILAYDVADVTIQNDEVVYADQDLGSSAYAECAPAGSNNPVPGDCGEAVHLVGVSGSRVLDNVVEDNAGGILVDDADNVSETSGFKEMASGPSDHNVIGGNSVIDNAEDCGITIVSHDPQAYTNGRLHQSLAGVYDNVIERNIADDNGMRGQGGGIILAGSGTGTAVYDNAVYDNTAHQNGLGGVTLHDHAAGEYMDGNSITDNNLSNNDTAGGPKGTPGDADTGGALTKSADLIVYSAKSLLFGTVIKGNTFSAAYYGVWTHNAPSITRSNGYSRISRHVSQAPAPVATTIASATRSGKHVDLAGRAEPYQRVTILGKWSGHGYQTVATVTASSKGSWSAKPAFHAPKETYQAKAYWSTSAPRTVRS
jgi:hypothetical protein